MADTPTTDRLRWVRRDKISDFGKEKYLHVQIFYASVKIFYISTVGRKTFIIVYKAVESFGTGLAQIGGNKQKSPKPV